MEKRWIQLSRGDGDHGVEGEGKEKISRLSEIEISMGLEPHLER